jgi:hypothetical protein
MTDLGNTSIDNAAITVVVLLFEFKGSSPFDDGGELEMLEGHPEGAYTIYA